MTDSSGQEVGAVTAVIGDQNVDIFDGLHVEGDGAERYVPADRVGRIEEGRVAIEAAFGQLEKTPAGGEPGGAEMRRDRDAEL